MNTGLVLRRGPMRCELRPDLGGCVTGLWLDDCAILRSEVAPAIQSVRQSALFPLVPFSNRLAEARLGWGGRDCQVTRNFLPERHAIHGTGWQRTWSVMQVGADAAELFYAHQPDEAWPFAFDCVQTVRVEDSALHLTMRVENCHDREAPVGIGWHPYVAKRPGSRLALAATCRWDIDAESLPTTARPSDGLDADCATLDINHCFEGWTGPAELRDGVLHTRITSSLDRLVISTNAGKNFVAIEPVSHVSNALAMTDPAARGIRILPPRAAFAGWMTIASTFAQRR